MRRNRVCKQMCSAFVSRLSRVSRSLKVVFVGFCRFLSVLSAKAGFGGNFVLLVESANFRFLVADMSIYCNLGV